MDDTELPRFLRRHASLRALVLNGCEEPPLLTDVSKAVDRVMDRALARPDGASYESGDGRVDGDVHYFDASVALELPNCEPGLGFLVLQTALPHDFPKFAGDLPLPRHQNASPLVDQLAAAPQWLKSARMMKTQPRYAQAILPCQVHKNGSASFVGAVIRYLDCGGRDGAIWATVTREGEINPYCLFHNALIWLNTRDYRPWASVPKPTIDTTQPGPYFLWLAEHEDDAGTLGDLARQAINDPEWPRAESDKNALRAYLRKSGDKEMIAVLAASVVTFHSELGTKRPGSRYRREFGPAFQRTANAWGQCMVPVAFEEWLNLGEPSAETLRKMAYDENDPAAMCILAIRYLAPTSRDREAEGRELLARAANDHAYPAAILGEARLIEGEAGSEGEKLRVEMFVRAAKLGNTEAAAESILHYLISDSPAKRKLGGALHREIRDATSDRGNLAGRIASLLSLGLGPVEAAVVYAAAIPEGARHIYGPLAEIYELSLNQPEKAAELRKQGVANGDPLCCLHEGCDLIRDSDSPADWLRAAEMIAVAARSGSADAIVNLAGCHFDGIGVEPDYERAVFLLAMGKLCGSDIADEEIRDRAIPNPEYPDFNRMVDWLTDAARDTRHRDSIRLAARIRFIFGTG